MKSLLPVLTFLLLSIGSAKADHFCSSQVKESAAALFKLHYGQVSIREARQAVSYSSIEELPSLRSPDRRRSYSVLETYAEIGRMGSFRIRMIYAVLGKGNPAEDCILMGQEILDLSSL